MSTGRDKERNNFLVDGLKTERMKTYSLPIDPVNDLRIKAIYEAPADTQDGQVCLKTLFVYMGESSSPILSKEVSSVWQESFNTEAVNKATADAYTVEEIEELGI